MFASGVGVEFLAFVTSSSLVFLSGLLLCEQNRTVQIKSGLSPINSLEYRIESAQTSVNVTELFICVIVRKRLHLARFPIPPEMIGPVSGVRSGKENFYTPPPPRSPRVRC